MAPEISLGRYDKTVDIYALGIMLYEMLTGQPPYVGESMGEVLMKHLSSDPDVSQLPEPFASVVVKAMQRDPANRFQTAQEMVEAVEGAAPPKPLYDSFNPTTLSLVGERARNAKAEQAAVQEIR
jgi:serine/threonine protein kinase